MRLEVHWAYDYWVAVKDLKVTILGKPYYVLYIPIMVT